MDWRSYEELGVNQIPTVHEGPTVRAMEAKGMETDLGSLNRMIVNLIRCYKMQKNFCGKQYFKKVSFRKK